MPGVGDADRHPMSFYHQDAEESDGMEVSNGGGPENGVYKHIVEAIYLLATDPAPEVCWLGLIQSYSSLVGSLVLSPALW